jgi:hypothetical protein
MTGFISWFETPTCLRLRILVLRWQPRPLPPRSQPELLLAVARQDQLQSRFRFDLALHEEAIAEKWDPLTMESL